MYTRFRWRSNGSGWDFNSKGYSTATNGRGGYWGLAGDAPQRTIYVFQPHGYGGSPFNQTLVGQVDSSVQEIIQTLPSVRVEPLQMDGISLKIIRDGKIIVIITTRIIISILPVLDTCITDIWDSMVTTPHLPISILVILKVRHL